MLCQPRSMAMALRMRPTKSPGNVAATDVLVI